MSEPIALERRPGRVPEALHPRLKLFLSADLVGSTPLKQPVNPRLIDTRHQPAAQGDEASPSYELWLQVIEGFYEDIDESFPSRWRETAKRIGVGGAGLMGPPPRRWKSVGDEVLYWKTLTSDLQLRVTLSCWIDAIQDLRRVVKRLDTAVDVKSTAWLAEFPVRNKVVWQPTDRPAFKRASEAERLTIRLEAIRRLYEEGEAGLTDFVGPGIDLGFRLSGWSTAERMSVSVDVAYLLSLTDAAWRAEKRPRRELPAAWIAEGEAADPLGVHYDGGRETLKGVLGGLPYPRFWIDMPPVEQDLSFMHRRLLRLDKLRPADAAHVAEFCGQFYEAHRTFVCRPFINAAGSLTLDNIPAGYEAILLSIVSDYGGLLPDR